MKRFAVLLLSLALLSACERRAESSASAGADFVVDRLFVHDGCTVYRFKDGGSARYFSRCDGAAFSGVSWSESCGKGCTRQVHVPTAGRGD